MMLLPDSMGYITGATIIRHASAQLLKNPDGGFQLHLHGVPQEVCITITVSFLLQSFVSRDNRGRGFLLLGCNCTSHYPQQKSYAIQCPDPQQQRCGPRAKNGTQRNFSEQGQLFLKLHFFLSNLFYHFDRNGEGRK